MAIGAYREIYETSPTPHAYFLKIPFNINH